VVRITGLRNPCRQLDAFAPGLMEAVLERRSDGTIVRKCGIMGVVVTGGTVRPGDPISVELPAGAHRRLERV
jgi:MOSC domain-containing protein YiiM